MSKRRLLELVNEKHVSGWDDPRLPTLAGLRRRGFSPEAIRNFCDRIGVAKRDSVVDYALLESVLREDLNIRAPRMMAVLNPLKVVIENFPEDHEETLEAVINPERPELGKRPIRFTRELYIERDDFMEDAPRKFYRLVPGREVRLRYAFFVTCTKVIHNEEGEVVELRCSYDPATKGGDAPDGRKVKATLHWVSAAHAVPAEVRLYDRLFTVENPNQVDAGGHFLDYLNPDSLTIQKNCMLEPDLAGKTAGWSCQFERLGYFCVDPDSRDGFPVFNRTVALRDTWARMQKKK